MEPESATVTVTRIRHDVTGDTIRYDNHVVGGEMPTGVVGCQLKSGNELILWDLGAALVLMASSVCNACPAATGCFVASFPSLSDLSTR